MLRKNLSTSVILIFVGLLLSLRVSASQVATFDPTAQTPALLYDEARTVYLGNLERRNNGVPPLRWNRQLTYAARWFSWDSTENEPSGFCGHVDSQGHPFYYRTSVFGYLGFAGAENAFCGYVSPESAIQGWMNSPGHRTNLLSPNSREIGVGYYRRAGDGRGYITQDFGSDDVYAPMIIENEAVATPSSNVNLYIYDRSASGGFQGLAAATQMMVSNDPYFEGASWEPYNANKAWTLTAGSGWRDVYVKTRDKFNRNLTVSDSIYLGAETSVPKNEISTGMQMSTTQSQVTLYNLNGGALSQVQFSPGWLADDTNGNFSKLWGNGESVVDAAAWGGTAFRLFPASGESSAWVWDTSFIKDTPMVAYVRLKVNNNSSNTEVARFSVEGGGTVYGPLSLKGTDFAAPNQYQEFALNFTFNTNPNDDFLIFQFWQSGNADVYVDAVSIFSAPQSITSPLTWSVPGNNYRGQGVWVRYTNGTQFSAISDGITTPDPSHTISGNVGIGGVTLSYTDGTFKTVTSSSNGNYSLSASAHWTGIVTPSHPCVTFNPVSRNYNNVTANQASQNYTATFNTAAGCADIQALIGGASQGRYWVPSSGSIRASFAGINNGPVKILSTNSIPLIGAERVIYKVNGTPASFTEMMALPDGQLNSIYWLPWYNNVDLDTQLRIGNVSGSTAQVHVYIGTDEMLNSPFALHAGQSTRVSFAGINNGPVKIQSDQSLVAAERVIYKVNATQTSFSEMMGLPDGQLNSIYWLPWYNNVDLDTQLRVGNVSNNAATVHIFIGGDEVTPVSGITLLSGTSTRVSFAGINNGPVKIESDQNIVAAERVIYKVNGVNTSFTEMMALSESQLNRTYWLPWYNNVDLDSQLRIGNVSGLTATVHIFIGGAEMTPVSGVSLLTGASTRVFPAHWDPKLRIPRGQVVAAASIVSPKY